MGTNCAPLVADLFLICYEWNFMMSHSDDKQADIIEAFNTTSRYLDDSLNLDNIYFNNMVSQYVFVLSCVCYVLCASVYMCFVVTCWERADLLALVCGVYCEFVTFPLVSWVRCGT